MITKDKFTTIIYATRADQNALTKYEKLAKLIEEVSGLSKYILAKDHTSRIMGMMELPLGKGSDVILTVIDILQICYPFLNSDELYRELQRVIDVKYAKWERHMILNARISDATAKLSSEVQDSPTISGYRHWADDRV